MRCVRTLGAPALLALLAQTGLAAEIHVPRDHATIQAAIDASANGDEIVLADGTYTGPGNKDITYLGKLITVRSASRNPASCVIDCEGAGRAFAFTTSEARASRLDGVTIANGRTGKRGGGVFVQFSGPTIANCVFRSCHAGVGGGLGNLRGNPLVVDCVFIDNSADFGAGMSSEIATGEIVRCTFRGNLANSYGGGVFSDRSPIPVTDTLFESNFAERCGAGLFNTIDVDVRVLRCVFRDNFTTGGGGGLYNMSSGPEIRECAFIRNRAAHGAGVGNVDSQPTVIDSTFCQNVTDQIEGDWIDGGGNEFREECACLADVDLTGRVDFEDLVLVLARWGPYDGCPPLIAADIDGDCLVGFEDVVAVLAGWGPCP